MYLESINGLNDLKKLNINQLKILCQEIRQFLLDTVFETGGHLASNLGIVELTVALHYVFDEQDKIIWDVGHQSYIHKILTGRKEELKTLRKNGGLSGFSNPKESNADAFLTGHASTSISAGLGMCEARDLQKKSYNIISVIGDGALTGGMAYEALNNIDEKNMLVILNDNNMSISKNVGGVSLSLSRLRLKNGYNKFKYFLTRFFSAIPLIGKFIVKFCRATKNFLKSLFGSNTFFSNFGVKYIGPFNGNDIKKLIKILTSIKKELSRPILLHIVTQKGKGYKEAEKNPEKFHGIYGKDCQPKKYSYSKMFGATLTELADNNDKICAVCAAMSNGTGLDCFAEKHKDRFFDVGIAEEHAVTFAAGLAKSGMKPFVAIYSTFLQRAYDQILHDVCIDNLPVVFCIDRAGFVGADGETHQGLFDLSFLTTIPNMTVIAPKDTNELKKALSFAAEYNAPLAIRYPKETDNIYEDTEFVPFTWEYVANFDSDISIFAVGGNMIKLAQNAALHYDKKINIINTRFIKPLDENMLKARSKDKKWIVLEENQIYGGLGEKITLFASENNLSIDIKIIAVKDKFVKHASIEEQLNENGFNTENIINLIEDKG